jgi:histidinol-phosphate/aromatic aminotransferase/cobyric acid decarboxylase-like protein
VEDAWIFDASAESLDFPGAVDMVYPIVQDREPPEGVRRALVDAVGKVARYPHLEREVSVAIGGYLGIPANRVLSAAGGNGALDLISRAFLAGRKVVVPLPAFWQIADAPRRHGARLSTPSLLGEDPVPAILAAFDDADAIMLCSPNNPLGCDLPAGLVPALLERSAGRPVVIDESYADMTGESHASTLHPDLVLARGFKVWTIPGARVGYIVAAPERLRACAAMRPPFESGVFAEAAALGAIEAIDDVRRIWDEVRADLRYLEGRLAEIGGTVTPSRTLFANWRHPEAVRVWSELKKRKIFCLSAESGVVYGMPDDMLRFTARRPDVVDHVAEEIKKIL